METIAEEKMDGKNRRHENRRNKEGHPEDIRGLERNVWIKSCLHGPVDYAKKKAEAVVGGPHLP